MSSNIRLRLGDLFDGPSDLIVLPCSTFGTVTGFVARTLSRYNLPHPEVGMELGDVEIFPFVGGEHIAQFIAFAASVANMHSTEEAIRSIGRTLGEFAENNASVRSIAAPLLGAGAGGIQSERVVAALRSAFAEAAPSGATLTVHVLHKDVFERLRQRKISLSGPRKNIRVFISHTSQNDSSVEWVKQLALQLIDHGIQARLDRFHLRKGMDLPQWMCNELAMADKVIVVCDQAYKAKADGRLGGVGWETMIIQGDLASLPPDSTKYQVVVREDDIISGLPVYLRTRYAFHARPSDSIIDFRDDLIRELLNLPLDERIEEREFFV